MRILLDESLPRRLISELSGHTVSTVTDQGWSGLENGELLRAAVDQFDVFLTADQNLEYQQNLSELPLSVVVLVTFRIGESNGSWVVLFAIRDSALVNSSLWHEYETIE